MRIIFGFTFILFTGLCCLEVMMSAPVEPAPLYALLAGQCLPCDADRLFEKDR